MESDKIRLITMVYEKSNEIFENIFVFYKINDMFFAATERMCSDSMCFE